MRDQIRVSVHELRLSGTASFPHLAAGHRPRGDGFRIVNYRLAPCLSADFRTQYDRFLDQPIGDATHSRIQFVVGVDAVLFSQRCHHFG
jgi:hypothetical protein